MVAEASPRRRADRAPVDLRRASSIRACTGRRSKSMGSTNRSIAASTGHHRLVEVRPSAIARAASGESNPARPANPPGTARPKGGRRCAGGTHRRAARPRRSHAWRGLLEPAIHSRQLNRAGSAESSETSEAPTRTMTWIKNRITRLFSRARFFLKGIPELVIIVYRLKTWSIRQLLLQPTVQTT